MLHVLKYYVKDFMIAFQVVWSVVRVTWLSCLWRLFKGTQPTSCKSRPQTCIIYSLCLASQTHSISHTFMKAMYLDLSLFRLSVFFVCFFGFFFCMFPKRNETLCHVKSYFVQALSPFCDLKEEVYSVYWMNKCLQNCLSLF